MDRKQKQIIVGLVAIAMLALNFGLQPVRDARALDQPTDVSNLLSDSGLNSMATSTITFTTASSTVSGDYWRVEFDADFDLSGATIECDGGDPGFAGSIAGQEVDCDWSGANIPAGTGLQMLVGNQINPIGEGTYHLYLYHYDSADRLKERADFMVAIQSHVVMHARVAATLTFDVSGVATTTTTYTGVECNDTTWPERLDFYTLDAGASSTLCHQLAVSTNASDGYIVTVEQDGNLRNAANDEINSFIMSPTGTGSSTQAFAWTAPVAQLDVDYTYGHMGLHSDDVDVDSAPGAVDFGTVNNPLYLGFNGVEPIIIMHHSGPTSNNIQNTGLSMVAYTAEITALQQAGDYYNTLTYICTATY